MLGLHLGAISEPGQRASLQPESCEVSVGNLMFSSLHWKAFDKCSVFRTAVR